MVFNSYAFIFWFFPVFFIFWVLSDGRKSFRLWLLLVASYIFYSWWDFRFSALMFFVSFVNWFAGYKLDKANSQAEKKMIVAVTLVLSLSPLFFFKYLPWLGSYCSLAFAGIDSRDIISSIILPVGISFFTFQALSYTIDFYRDECEYCPSLLKFTTFVSMFPQLVAGPIIRFTDIYAQLETIDRLGDNVDFGSGIELFSRGLIKKVLFADRIGVLIDPTFAMGADVSSGLAWISILAYSLQIYFDFSGYTDMAIGLGRCMGFRFPDNFLAPYTAANPSEFWRRWHITLSTWLRDYLYIPLGGNRKGKFRTLTNIMITMLLGGLWHGAAWTFVFWGFWHGVLLLAHRTTPSSLRKRMPNWLAVLLLNLGVLVGWVFFRMPTMDQAFSFLQAMAGRGSQAAFLIPWQLYLLVVGGYIIHLLERRDQDHPFKRGKKYAILLAVIASLAILDLGRDTPFIYFQF